MKNIHVLPTDKPSSLGYHFDIVKTGKVDYAPDLGFKEFNTKNNFQHRPQFIYITSDENKKIGDYVYDNVSKSVLKITNITESITATDEGYFKVILTTDQDLIKDGVQAIDDNFLEWFVKNPSCERVEVEIESKFDRVDGHYHDVWEIIIPKEELHSMDDEVECNNCGNLRSLTEDESIYVCYNSECTSCYEPYEEEEAKQDFILVKEDCPCIDECMYYLSKQCKHLKEEPKQTVQEYEQQGLEKHSFELEAKQETLEEREWLPIFNEYVKDNECNLYTFFNWLETNYNSPTKK